MKNLAHLCCVLFLLVCAREVPGQAPPGKDETFSENKKFSAEISMTRLDRPLLTVFNHDGGKRLQVWTRSLVTKEAEEDPDFARIPIDPDSLRTIVSNDGKVVILRARYRYNDPALRVLMQNGADKSYDEDELMDLLEEQDESSQEIPFLELFLETEKPPLYALWSPPGAEWLVLNLDKPTLQKADASMSKHLDGLALPRARDLARLSRPTGIKKLLRPMIAKASNYLPGLTPPEQSQSLFETGEAAFRF
jgi:hypothetical protein